MDRTEEFLKVARIFDVSGGGAGFNKEAMPASNFLKTAFKISVNSDGNEKLIKRIETLCIRKEFSNDPTNDMSEVSDLFEKKISIAKKDMENLKRLSYNNYSYTVGLCKQQLQHYELIVQTLNKRIAKHIGAFQSAFKSHSEHIKQRHQRVSKYGQSQEKSIVNNQEYAENYALFANKSANNSNLNELRRRSAHVTQSNINSTSTTIQDEDAESNSQDKPIYDSKHKIQTQNQMQINKNNSTIHFQKAQRLKNAQNVETKILQMGSLFQQMATLVMEQSETITRIEDDVEIGLQHTTEAHKSMESFYEISKGNRSMIIKVFVLLIVFIIIFLVLT